MAWTVNADSNLGLVSQLQEAGVFHSNEVHRVMAEVDRADFVPIDPYLDSPQSIGYSATISAPHMHATAIEGLIDVIRPNSHILDVGSGSGYLTACFAKLLGPEGMAVGVEHIEELVKLSNENVRKHHANLLDSGRIQFVVGDGRKGYPPGAPYDAIHVGAAAEEMPNELIDQLAVGGRMLIPVGAARNQEFIAVEKLADGTVQKRVLAHVVYMPLTEKEKQYGRSFY